MVMETIALSSSLAGGGVSVEAKSREMTDNGPHFKVFLETGIYASTDLGD